MDQGASWSAAISGAITDADGKAEGASKPSASYLEMKQSVMNRHMMLKKKKGMETSSLRNFAVQSEVCGADGL